MPFTVRVRMTMTFRALQLRVRLLGNSFAALARKLSGHSLSYLEQFPEAVLLPDRPVVLDQGQQVNQGDGWVGRALASGKMVPTKLQM